MQVSMDSSSVVCISLTSLPKELCTALEELFITNYPAMVFFPKLWISPKIEAVHDLKRT
ncbi:hypothetical protein LguiB_012452 [Lonicera macranthoides]